MPRLISGSAVASVIAACLLASGCGGAAHPTLPQNPFAYNASKALLVQRGSTAIDGPVMVRSLSYATFDGSRVPALFAIPRRGRTSGCLMYQPGRGVPKEAAAWLWPLAARLGLAVFTIDPRYTGARATPAARLNHVLGTPQGLISFYRKDVIDLRRGLDYLESQASCHHDVGYMGLSEGSGLGVLLSGADDRIRATVLCSIGGSWRAALLYVPVSLQRVAKTPATIRNAAAQLAPLSPTRWIVRIAPRPVMLVAGLRDPLIPPVSALQLFAAARQPKQFLFQPDGHNPFVSPYARLVSGHVGAFLGKYLVGAS